jgi:hypothetical protein
MKLYRINSIKIYRACDQKKNGEMTSNKNLPQRGLMRHTLLSTGWLHTNERTNILYFPPSHTPPQRSLSSIHPPLPRIKRQPIIRRLKGDSSTLLCIFPVSPTSSLPISRRRYNSPKKNTSPGFAVTLWPVSSEIWYSPSRMIFISWYV